MTPGAECPNPTPASITTSFSAPRTAFPRSHPRFEGVCGNIIGGIVRNAGGIPIQIGGIEDHVHLLVTLRQQSGLADFLRELKAGSSGWVHDTFPEAKDFWWQTGYGAFTVSHSARDEVRKYIANQEEHHKTMSYQDELRALLVKHGIAFDEKYLWD